MAIVRSNAVAAVAALMLLIVAECRAFTAPSSSATARPAARGRGGTGTALFASNAEGKSGGVPLFFADETATATGDEAEPASAPSAPPSSPSNQLFDSATLAEANDALSGVGWAGVAPMSGEGEMTSDDPFVRSIDESVRRDTGVGLDELLNPAKVVNLERDLYNLRAELAALTGGPDADAIQSKIDKKERDLALERRSVFRGWLKSVFLGQAVISAALSYVMATNPDSLFGGFALYRDTANMDTSVKVLGFWWWWLFIVPSLRSRRPTGAEKRALDIAFLGTPLISLLSPVVTKDTGAIWFANLAVVAGAYGFAFLAGEEDGDEGDGDESKRPGWLKFVYKSLDFGSGRERGARR
eukprot:CAMPEP_0172535316 /NCGR_PEP_ID=MMETSP1067-20121228/7382_1 /TAXON_ID=265564 ORGANISM="Thalassiosira punctigera, Strain Tpunct2005C2" /NCGR_SAMPLE_ID=MMETSP1067 /ASSEMBLY_ACC=CAM_ASM_000444 /LENGTH=355 /DNA_ID=CAMNT_0013320245 /DNA_START=13 /DNA_END=1080 /DNA_ORIENTATION=-